MLQTRAGPMMQQAGRQGLQRVLEAGPAWVGMVRP